MNRRGFLKALACAGLAFGAGGKILAAPAKKRPNFVFILVDDLGWADLGCYGSSFYETPNLDKLAASAMRFTDAYAACPVCSPTRAAILTGKYPPRFNITDWIPGDDPKDRKLLGPRDLNELPLAETTLAETLKKNGYATFFAGKWHLGGDGFLPEDQGFDINKGGYRYGSPPGGYYVPYKNVKLPDGPEGEYLTDRLTQEAMQFLETNREEKPFLLYLSFYTVHTPIQACKRHEEKFNAKRAGLPEMTATEQVPEHEGLTKQRQDHPAYATMVHAMDENVGRLLAKLDELKLSDNTVVIFTSDNGGLSTRRNQSGPTCNLPLRAGKGWCYEGGIRVPLIIRAPGVARGDASCGVPVISVDFYPTVLELAGIAPTPEQPCDGLSLTPLLRGGDALAREAIFWHYPHYHTSAWTPGAALRAGDWKLIEFYNREKVELYNLRDDVGERNELSQKMPEKTRDLLRMLHEWQKSVGAQFAQPNPGYRPGAAGK